MNDVPEIAEKLSYAILFVVAGALLAWILLNVSLLFVPFLIGLAGFGLYLVSPLIMLVSLGLAAAWKGVTGKSKRSRKS